MPPDIRFPAVLLELTKYQSVMVLFLCIVLRNLPYKPHHIENMSKGLETELWMAATTNNN